MTIDKALRARSWPNPFFLFPFSFCLQALRACSWPNTRTLANEIGVDRRTIRRDIDYLRDQLNAAN
jgi:hypothetical protein